MREMSDDPSGWHIEYLGWSGFHVHNSDNRHIFIDPPTGTVFPDDVKCIIFITHGHPEHLGGTIDHIRMAKREQNTRVIASATVCRYLSGECRRGKVDFIIAKSGQKFGLTPDISFEAFSWRHMPLLPPGLGAAVRHIIHIVMRFHIAWRIVKLSLKGPKGPGDMLGYLLYLSGDKNIIIYGEGLHRHCRVEDVAAVGRKALGATLLVASEPEDFTELPELVAASGACEAILYEPHRLWRDIFELPYIDLQALQKIISDRGILTKISNLD